MNLIIADKNQLEQVIINLVKNSIEAIENKSDGKITIVALKTIDDKISIKITDNSKGIPPDIKEKIFLPFFTTKQNGSGIGLSLARQIIRMHGGNIEVESVLGKKTTFTLMF